MRRLLAAIKTDATLQARNQLYTIGLGVGTVMAMIFAALVPPTQLGRGVPVVLLLVIGGSTLLYVAGILLMEDDQGTLDAVVVSPLRPWEYLTAKVLTLTLLATCESAVLIGGAMAWMAANGSVPSPNYVLLVAGTAALGALNTLVGVILAVRYDAITDLLVPMAAVASVLQLGFLYFLGVFDHWALLAIPTTAPAMIVHGAFTELSTGLWVYATSYTGVSIVATSVWAGRAFHRHVVLETG